MPSSTRCFSENAANRYWINRPCSSSAAYERAFTSSSRVSITLVLPNERRLCLTSPTHSKLCKLCLSRYRLRWSRLRRWPLFLGDAIRACVRRSTSLLAQGIRFDATEAEGDESRRIQINDSMTPSAKRCAPDRRVAPQVSAYFGALGETSAEAVVAIVRLVANLVATLRLYLVRRTLRTGGTLGTSVGQQGADLSSGVR
jgi:hypothetical protein